MTCVKSHTKKKSIQKAYTLQIGVHVSSVT